jgi:hypothetical protein
MQRAARRLNCQMKTRDRSFAKRKGALSRSDEWQRECPVLMHRRSDDQNLACDSMEDYS